MRTLILLITGLLACSPLVANAVTMYVTAPETVNVHDVFAAEIFLDTEGENINAVEGSVVLPENVIVREVRYRGSVVSLWLSNPAERNSEVVDFAGVIPGGYQATPDKVGRGNLFTLVLSASKTGTGRLSFGTETSAYTNDGEGTKILASKNAISVSVLENGASKGEAIGEDTLSPESFTPVVVSGEPYGREGSVLIFATQDKDSGVMKYEIGSSYFKFFPEAFVVWIEAESPYTLSKAQSDQYVFVRARDTAGNTRIEVVSPAFSATAFTVTWLVPVLILLVLGFLLRPLFKRGIMYRRK